MSLNAIINTAQSGMIAAQSGLRVTSDNIANVNTPGYVRKSLVQTSQVANGMGVGVNVAGVERAANTYLQTASLAAGNASAKAGVRSELLDNAQALFGDPSGDNYYLNKLDTVLAAFSASADDPASTLRQTQAVTAVQDFLTKTTAISKGLTDITHDADTRLVGAVDRVNALLQQIEGLNGQITAQKAAGGDTSGSENLQSGMLDELSSLMDIGVGPRPNGGVLVRSPDGQILAGAGAATVGYNRSGGGDSFLTVTLAGGSGVSSGMTVSGGQIGGLLSLRNNEIPAIGEQLGEYAAKTTEEINRAANAATAAPPPNTLTGKNTGLDLPTALDGFTGVSTIVITGSDGVVQKRVDIDFGTGQMTVDGVAGPTFANTPAVTPTSTSFLTSLNTALGGAGTASFANGVLSLAAQTGSGVAVVDDAANPSTKAGKGFSHFFGLNDIIRANQPTDQATGLKATSLGGFVAGGTMILRVTDADGARLRDVTVTIPSAGTIQDVVDAMNSGSNGLGQYGAFALDSAGRLAFTPRSGSGTKFSVVQDSTARGAGGPSITQLFGLGQTQRAARAGAFFVDPQLTANPRRLPFAKLDLTVAAGKPVVAAGDGNGALGLSRIADVVSSFSGVAGQAGASTTLSRYSAQFGGQVARAVDDAATSKDAAESVKSEADNRRSSIEGVNLDEELVHLTTYQQAFSASARLIQASKDLFDALLSLK